jgi:hypothetical protein
MPGMEKKLMWRKANSGLIEFTIITQKVFISKCKNNANN